MVDEKSPENLITGPVPFGIVARDVSGLMDLVPRDQMELQAPETAIPKTQTMFREASFIMLHSLDELGDSDAALLATRLRQLAADNPLTDLHEVAKEYEKKRTAAEGATQQRQAERAGELARAVAATTTATMVRLIKGPDSADSEQLSEARNRIAKVKGFQEGTNPAREYLSELLTATEAATLPPPQA
jgi:hypothetical protein